MTKQSLDDQIKEAATAISEDVGKIVGNKEERQDKLKKAVMESRGEMEQETEEVKGVISDLSAKILGEESEGGKEKVKKMEDVL